MDIKKYVSMGLVHAMAYPESNTSQEVYLKTLEKTIKDEYFEVAEIIPPLNDKMYTDVANLVKGSGMDFVYCATPAQYGQKLDLNSFDYSVAKHAVDVLKKEIDNAHRLGINKVQICSGNEISGIKNRAKAREILIENIMLVCDYAKTANVNVVLEIFDFDIEKKRFLGNSIDSAIVADAVRAKYDNFGLLQDLSHIPIMYEKPYPALMTVRNSLVHTHIGNCVMRDRNHIRFGDTHPIFSIPEGEVGVNELTEFIESLFAIGYLGEGKKNPISFEIKPFPGEDSDEYIKIAKETFEIAWNRAEK